VIIADDIDLPAQSELMCRFKIMCHDGSTFQEKKPTQWATERKALRPGVHVAGTVVPEGSTTVFSADGKSAGRSRPCWQRDNTGESGAC